MKKVKISKFIEEIANNVKFDYGKGFTVKIQSYDFNSFEMGQAIEISIVNEESNKRENDFRLEIVKGKMKNLRTGFSGQTLSNDFCNFINFLLSYEKETFIYDTLIEDIEYRIKIFKNRIKNLKTDMNNPIVSAVFDHEEKIAEYEEKIKELKELITER